jgi:hypothetical protein
MVPSEFNPFYFGVAFDEGYVVDTAQGVTLANLHPTTGPYYPFGIELLGTNLKIVIRTPSTVYPNGINVANTPIFIPVETRKWYDFKVDFKPHATNGRIYVDMNGARILTFDGITDVPEETKGYYPIVEAYKYNWPWTSGLPPYRSAYLSLGELG